MLVLSVTDHLISRVYVVSDQRKLTHVKRPGAAADHRYERNELGQIVDREQARFHQLSGIRRPLTTPITGMPAPAARMSTRRRRRSSRPTGDIQLASGQSSRSGAGLACSRCSRR